MCWSGNQSISLFIIYPCINLSSSSRNRQERKGKERGRKRRDRKERSLSNEGREGKGEKGCFLNPEIWINRVDEYWRELVGEGLSVLRGSTETGKGGDGSVEGNPMRYYFVR